MAKLEGKSAVITGAANGIGLAASRLFAAEGAKLVLVDRDEAGLRALASELGPAAHPLPLDVCEDDSARRYVAEAVERHGKVDCALLNAGIEGEVTPIVKASLATFDRVMAVNVRSVWLGLAALMPAMKGTGGGSIVITSSIAGLRATPNLAAYSASKHAVVGLMRSASLEGAADGIRVNTVHPGPIDTRMVAALHQARNPADASVARQAGLARIPLGRYGLAEEVAALMLFLSCDDASFCTGSTYNVDGGSMNR